MKFHVKSRYNSERQGPFSAKGLAEFCMTKNYVEGGPVEQLESEVYELNETVARLIGFLIEKRIIADVSEIRRVLDLRGYDVEAVDE